MERAITLGQITVHPSALTKAGITRLASHLSAERLRDERLTLVKVTQLKFEELRQECLDLGRVMEVTQPEDVQMMMEGLKIFTENFLKLAERIDAAIAGNGEEGGMGSPSDA
ncbi:hypothetical protein AEAC466_05020 [Asticcacaulis sp. AC466]|uniref:hypothetical protein n=1 Tax=Asticcacaulis sp. AC466 TaxID=1282362 RepID=UPI0003C412FE|nr:hypothetical protein [Asticcacaulis sp. AC466]ESQ85072.1 hypothetical protein AEAC466_05020 [Asticcacaulis sp. AC466]